MDVLHFTDTTDQISNLIAPVTLPSGHTIMVAPQGVTDADGITGQIVANTMIAGTYDVTFTDPSATAGQTFAITVTGTDGTSVTGTVTSGGSFNFTPATTGAVIADFTATVTLDSSLSVTLNSQGVSGVNGASGQLVADPINGGYDVDITSDSAEQHSDHHRGHRPAPRRHHQANHLHHQHQQRDLRRWQPHPGHRRRADPGRLRFRRNESRLRHGDDHQDSRRRRRRQRLHRRERGHEQRTGRERAGPSFGLVEYTTTDTADSANNSSTYALTASSGNVSLVGISGLTLGGTFQVSVNTTGQAVNESIQVPGVSAPVPVVFAGAANVDSVSGTLNLQVSNFLSLQGSYDVQSSTPTAGSPATTLIGLQIQQAFIGVGNHGSTAPAANSGATGLSITGGSLGLAGAGGPEWRVVHVCPVRYHRHGQPHGRLGPAIKRQSERAGQPDRQPDHRDH